MLNMPPNILLPLAGITAFLLTYIFTFGVIALCRRFGWVEAIQKGKIHTTSVPRLGGVAIFSAFLLVSLIFYVPTLTANHLEMEKIFGREYPKEFVVYVLFILASLLIVAVHAYDDVKGLKPLPKLLAQTCAVIILLGPGLHNFHGVLFFGFHNPFGKSGMAYNPAFPWYEQSTITLFIRAPIISWLAIPAIVFTWFWFTGMMNAVNFIDGLDGLAIGIVAIAGLFITITSWILQQYTIACLAAIFTGAALGFLPHNWNPARIFMGDSGSQFLGIGLAVLAVMGGAKFALMLIVLGIPVLDIALVALHRIQRGQNPMKKDDLALHYHQTHLHYRLLFGGLNARQICLILYGMTFMFGILALVLPPLYKFLGFLLVGLVMIILLLWSRRLQSKREAEKKLEPEPAFQLKVRNTDLPSL